MCILQRNSQLGNAEHKQHMYLYKIVNICERPYRLHANAISYLIKVLYCKSCTQDYYCDYW